MGYPNQLVPLRAGDLLDHYRVESVVATSGMSTIYRATDLRSPRMVAIKLPHFELESDPVFFDRFQREETIGATLDHPGIIKVFRESKRSRLYMVLEWVEGRLLRQLLNERGRLAPDQAIQIALQVCNVLEYIHSQGVVHRDLKPENIMVDDHDRIKLIDFGIAAKAGARRLTFGKFSRTQGTPDYVSPEQIRGKRGDARSDLYSLGVIVYEMLTGETPFSGADPFVVLNAKTRSDAPRLRGIAPELPPALDEIVARTLERDPVNRYHEARELGWDLQHQDQSVGGRQPRALDKSRDQSNLFRYVLLGLVPLFILALLLYVAVRG